MKSTFLCVIGIRLLSQVLAQNSTNTTDSSVPSAFVVTPKLKIYWDCADLTGSMEHMILFVKGRQWIEEPALKAWVHCVLVSHNLMTDQGVFRLDIAFRGLSPIEKKELEANIDFCLPTKAMPPIEIAWQFAKCFQIVDPENSLF